jgi:hypothetical protein
MKKQLIDFEFLMEKRRMQLMIENKRLTGKFELPSLVSIRNRIKSSKNACDTYYYNSKIELINIMVDLVVLYRIDVLSVLETYHLVFYKTFISEPTIRGEIDIFLVGDQFGYFIGIDDKNESENIPQKECVA